MSKDINVTSTLFEKGIDLAKGFLEKIIYPPLEQVGSILTDKVSLWKFGNQVRMLTKARAICERNNISPQAVPLKLLCPLLDHAALEEDEFLQDKWATLLSNLVDSEQNIQNHVFPYILSQVSKEEFAFLEASFIKRRNRISTLTMERDQLLREKDQTKSAIQKRIDELKSKAESLDSLQKHKVWDEIFKLNTEIHNVDWKPRSLEYKIAAPEAINPNKIKGYELANLIRLGMISLEIESEIGTETIDTGEEIAHDHGVDTKTHEVVTSVETVKEHVLTDLCIEFISACTEKKDQAQNASVILSAPEGN